MSHILMIAAENGALPGGKVGGIGDVVREMPLALAQRDCRVSVVTPAFGVFHELPGARRLQTLEIRFGGATQSLQLFRIDGITSNERVCHYVIEHPLFSRCGAGRIYCDDPPGRPFETDASKFALFCAAVAEAIEAECFRQHRCAASARLARGAAACPAPLRSGLPQAAARCAVCTPSTTWLFRASAPSAVRSHRSSNGIRI